MAPIASTSRGPPAIDEAESAIAALPIDDAASQTASPAPARPTMNPSALFAAGAIGGLCGAVATAPFDLVKTRLQSTTYHSVGPSNGVQRHGVRKLLWHFADTGGIIRNIYRTEGPFALFRGLGPTLVGVMPARSINWASYGTGKRLYSRWLTDGRETTGIHLLSAATAGVVTGSATNPIWVVKTRLQLQQRSPVKPAVKSSASGSFFNHPQHTLGLRHAHMSTAAAEPLPFRNSAQCVAHIARTEGVRGFYRGLSASYLGVAEGTIQWTLYEQFKIVARRRADSGREGAKDQMVAAGLAKLIATVATYPHEVRLAISSLVADQGQVVRTRLREGPATPGQPAKYHGLLQTFRLVVAEEGALALYAGLSPHLLRTVPNAIVLYAVAEAVLRFSSSS